MFCDFVSEVVIVDDDEIIFVMKMCYEVLKLVVELSGVIGLVVILLKKFKNLGFEIKNIGIIFLGGNVDLEVLWVVWKYNF